VTHTMVAVARHWRTMIRDVLSPGATVIAEGTRNGGVCSVGRRSNGRDRRVEPPDVLASDDTTSGRSHGIPRARRLVTC
jgi:hypothetical protein